MNDNLLAIVKQIAAEYGEDVLTDPKLLKAFFGDLAKDEPKPLRLAFGRAVEEGAYTALKSTPDAAERASRKVSIAQNLRDEYGLDVSLSGDALDILETALFGEAKPLCAVCGKALDAGWKACPFCGAACGMSPPEAAAAVPVPENAPPQYQPPPSQYEQPYNPPTYQQQAPPPNINTEGAASDESGAAMRNVLNAVRKGKISRKSLIFGAAAGAGALIGELIGRGIFNGLYDFNMGIVLAVTVYYGIRNACISIALIVVQHILQRKQPDFNALLPVLLCITSVFVASGIILALFDEDYISHFVMKVSICMVYGTSLGLSVSFFIPNYPKKRSVLAGLAGGILGGAIYVALAGSYIGVIVLGFAIGLAIPFIEEALREAWLTVIWEPKASVDLALGLKPIVFGSSPKADVFLPSLPGSASVSPVRAVAALENGHVVLDDKATGLRNVLQNGGEFTLDNLRIVVNTKS
jgi:hypothetical protein